MKSSDHKNDKYDRIKDKKVSTTIESLTRGVPEEFNTYLQYCRNLKFEERPDYNYMRKCLKDLMYKRGHDFDYQLKTFVFMRAYP